MSKLSFLAPEEDPELVAVNDDPEADEAAELASLEAQAALEPDDGSSPDGEHLSTYHSSDRPTTVREEYEAAWRLKQSLR